MKFNSGGTKKFVNKKENERKILSDRYEVMINDKSVISFIKNSTHVRNSKKMRDVAKNKTIYVYLIYISNFFFLFLFS